MRLVARAVGRDESTVRNWSRKKKWKERLAECGPGSQTMALSIYRRDYLYSRGRLELESVRPNVSGPLVPGDAVDILPPDSVAEGTVDLATGEKKRGNPQGNGKERPNPELDVIKKGIVLYDAAIASFARQLAGGDVKVRARDVPFLVGSRRKLQRDLDHITFGESPDSGAGVEIPESYRVKQARSTGGNVVQALRADAEDLVLLLRAIDNQTNQNVLEMTGIEEA